MIKNITNPDQSITFDFDDFFFEYFESHSGAQHIPPTKKTTDPNPEFLQQEMQS